MIMVSSSTIPSSRGLPDDVGAAHDVDVFAAGRLDRPLDRRPDARHEGELATLRLFLRPVGHDEARQPPRVLVAPVPGRLIGPAPADHRADPGAGLRQPRGVLAGRFALRFVVICPGSTEHPVVEPFATLAEPLVRPVVRPRDVSVRGRRDPGQNLGHQRSPPLGQYTRCALETVPVSRTHRAGAMRRSQSSSATAFAARAAPSVSTGR